MPTRERGETFVYTINCIIINHLNHFNIHAVVCTFHPSQLKFAYYSFTKASRLKAWRHCSQQLALLGWQETQGTCDNIIYPFFFKAHPQRVFVFLVDKYTMFFFFVFFLYRKTHCPNCWRYSIKTYAFLGEPNGGWHHLSRELRWVFDDLGISCNDIQSDCLHVLQKILYFPASSIHRPISLSLPKMMKNEV